jgi:GntR family transcriptional regulator
MDWTIDESWCGADTGSVTTPADPSSKPLYSRLEEIVRERIGSGEWPVGTLIPSERELSHEFGLSRTTTRRALERLAAEGVLRTEPRRGTFVAEPKATFEALSLTGFTTQALETGASPETLLLHFERVLPTARVVERLGLAHGDLVYAIERLRTVDGVPLALHKSLIPVELAPDLQREQIERRSLYELLAADHSVKVGHAQETLQSALATEYEAVLLQVQPGAPVLLLDIRLTTEDSRPMELVTVVFRGDRVTLRQEL